MMKIALPESNDLCNDENRSVRTTASVSPDSQYVQTGCVYCCKSKGSLVSLPTGLLAHEYCRENKPCCICGIPNMCLQCKHPECSRVFHQFCLGKLAPYSRTGDQSQFCDLHSVNHGKKKRYLKVSATKLVISRISSNEYLLRSIKEFQGKPKSENLCSGNLL